MNELKMPPERKPPIQAWEYDNAPEVYRGAIEDPSDLDWIVFVPSTYGDDPYLSFVRDNDLTTILPVEGGRLYLFSHA